MTEIVLKYFISLIDNFGAMFSNFLLFFSFFNNNFNILKIIILATTEIEKSTIMPDSLELWTEGR